MERLCPDVVLSQIPAFESRTAHPQARYELGCLYIGTNDLRLPNWDAESFAGDFTAALAFLAGRCDRVPDAHDPRTIWAGHGPGQGARSATRGSRRPRSRQGRSSWT